MSYARNDSQIMGYASMRTLMIQAGKLDGAVEEVRDMIDALPGAEEKFEALFAFFNGMIAPLSLADMVEGDGTAKIRIRSFRASSWRSVSAESSRFLCGAHARRNRAGDKTEHSKRSYASHLRLSAVKNCMTCTLRALDCGTGFKNCNFEGVII